MLLKNCSSWKNAQLFDVNVIYKICGKLVYYSKSNCEDSLMPRLLPKLNWHCASLRTRISKSQEIILGNLGSDSKVWTSSNKYSTLEQEP